MINFVYFDVGGVVIKDFSGTTKWDELLNELGVTSANRKRFDEIWDATSGKHSTTLDVDDLVPVLRKELNSPLPSNYSLLMGFVSRFEKNQEIWHVISEIKKEVPVGLLTNMYPRMFDKINAAGILPSIDWDVIVDSSVVKLQKPDAAIYKLAEIKAKKNGDSILFVDNSQAHLDVAAKNFGWQTFLFDPRRAAESLEELLSYFISTR